MLDLGAEVFLGVDFFTAGFDTFELDLVVVFLGAVFLDDFDEDLLSDDFFELLDSSVFSDFFFGVSACARPSNAMRPNVNIIFSGIHPSLRSK